QRAGRLGCNVDRPDRHAREVEKVNLRGVAPGGEEEFQRLQIASLQRRVLAPLGIKEQLVHRSVKAGSRRDQRQGSRGRLSAVKRSAVAKPRTQPRSLSIGLSQNELVERRFRREEVAERRPEASRRRMPRIALKLP